MKLGTHMGPIALAAIAAICSSAPTVVQAAAGQYVAGDFHNHTTCSDGSISMQKLVDKSTGKNPGTWGLDWFVQAGHGGNGNRNCTLVEDASLSTPAYPYVAGQGPTTTWANSIGTDKLKGLNAASSGNMWRWQSIKEIQYPLMEYLSAYKNVPLFIGLESVVAGHEHSSMSVITGQMPKKLDKTTLPTSAGYTALGNADALAKWSYCFDRGDSDTSRGAENLWDCSVTGSLNAADPSWNATAMKLLPASGTGTGSKGHAKTLEALKWMAENHGTTSYYVPAHLERAGPFYADGNQGYNIEHLRNFNNAAPSIAFGFESQPGHGAANNRGEYQVRRNNFGANNFDIGGGTKVNVDSVGGTTYGGTGVYAAVVGGVWDALLGEGRNWWFFASSDWHNRGSFGADDRRSTQDFQPGEYQRNYTLVRNGNDKVRPQTIVDGLRGGDNFASSGQLIDRLSMIVCASNASAPLKDIQVANYAMLGASKNTASPRTNCVSMGQKLKVNAGDDVIVGIAVRDPAGTNNSPYTFNNPSLSQVGISQALNMPVLDHIDLIGGLVTGYKTPGAADYSGEWPRNTDWLRSDGTTAGLSSVPSAAKNTTAAILKTFSSASKSWTAATSSVDGTTFLKMAYRIPAVSASQYVRLRGTNLPASVPYETDANGNPLADLFTNANDATMLRIPCSVAHSSGSQFDGCPDHLATATSGTNKTGTAVTNPIAGQKAVSYDVAAWSDLWFYSNPVYVEVNGSTVVAGLK